jgi:LysR family transcriptional regulator, glycine cleavage system transcriptional activator
MSQLPLRAVHAFEVVARQSSLKLAAEELSVTPSAISHQIRCLEEHLGVALFHRFNRRVVLTDAGRSFYDRIYGAFGQIDHAAKLVTERGFTDLLTVHCPPSFAPAWLLPRAKSFLDRYPTIELRVHAAPEQADFVHQADLEIRYGNGDWPWLHVRPLMPEIVTPLCAPSLLPNRAQTLGIHELRELPLIHSERSMVTWAAWFAANGSEPGGLIRGLRFDRGYLAIQAAAQGLGVALENTVFANRELKSGDLVAPFADRAVHFNAGRHYLVCPQENLEKPKVRSFYDWLMGQVQQVVSGRPL